MMALCMGLERVVGDLCRSFRAPDFSLPDPGRCPGLVVCEGLRPINHWASQLLLDRTRPNFAGILLSSPTHTSVLRKKRAVHILSGYDIH